MIILNLTVPLLKIKLMNCLKNLIENDQDKNTYVMFCGLLRHQTRKDMRDTCGTAT